MYKLSVVIGCICLLLASCAERTGPGSEEPQEISQAEPMEEKVVKHVVIFKFKDESPEEEVEKIHQSFLALEEAIPVVKGFEWGMNHSPEGLDQDFTHCYTLTFATEEDRDSVYAPHPSHQAFVASLEPHLEKV
ncbi:MAG: Dabb family protein, partial [Bacteroidota bacterium]